MHDVLVVIFKIGLKVEQKMEMTHRVNAVQGLGWWLPFYFSVAVCYCQKAIKLIFTVFYQIYSRKSCFQPAVPDNRNM